MPKKRHATFSLPEDLIQECRDAVVFLSGPPLQLTMSKLVEESLRSQLQELKKRYNQGKEFPRHTGELKTGRPITL